MEVHAEACFVVRWLVEATDWIGIAEVGGGENIHQLPGFTICTDRS